MYAMLSIDLDKKITTEQRNRFNEYLEKEDWTKIPNVTTTWYTSFVDSGTESGIINATQKDVSNAARHAGIVSYAAAVNVGSSKPTSF